MGRKRFCYTIPALLKQLREYKIASYFQSHSSALQLNLDSWNKPPADKKKRKKEEENNNHNKIAGRTKSRLPCLAEVSLISLPGEKERNLCTDLFDVDRPLDE